MPPSKVLKKSRTQKQQGSGRSVSSDRERAADAAATAADKGNEKPANSSKQHSDEEEIDIIRHDYDDEGDSGRFHHPPSGATPVQAVPVYRQTGKDQNLWRSLRVNHGIDCVKLLRVTLAEFLGTAILLFIVSLSFGHKGDVKVLYSAVAYGFTLVLLITSFAHISGGHFNPAVTFGLLMSGNLSLIHSVCYMIAQFLGSFTGALLVKAMMTDEEEYEALTNLPKPNLKFTIGSNLSCELLLSFILVTVQLNALVDFEARNPSAPLAIGSAAVVGVIAGSQISGGSMNPARNFGPTLVRTIFAKDNAAAKSVWNNQYLYYVGPLLGALIAAIFYKMIFGEVGTRLIGGYGHSSTRRLRRKRISYMEESSKTPTR